MKRLGVALVGITAFGLVLFMGGPAIGGDYHRGATLICSDCHVMHYSQSHGYNADGTGFFTTPGMTGPYGYLLRNEINDLCLTCHDGSAFAPDVLEMPTGAPLVRQAGALNRSGTAPYYNATGHTLDSTDTAPGGTWAPDPAHGLVCTDCHSPHGRGGVVVTNGYRNLNRDVGTGTVDPPSYTDGPAPRVNDLTRDIFVRTAGDYDISQVDFNEPDPTASAYGAWCGGCHADFHGAVGSTQIGGSGAPPEHFDRHPVAGVDIGALGGGHSNTSVFAYGPTRVAGTKINWVKVMTATENWMPNDPTLVTDHTPSCMTCHKGHGNRNAFGLIYMNADSGAITEEGVAGGVYKDLCKQCHVQG